MGRFVFALVRWIVRVFYRVEVLGDAVPARGPILLVGNHPGGLADPALLLCTTQRPLLFLSKAPLFRVPGLGAVLRAMGAVPVYRSQDGYDTGQNAGAFEAVHEALATEKAIALFPEGKSHSLPGLAELKTGAARMALAGEGRARIVPVGITYANKAWFRSRVSLWVGASLDAEAWRAQNAADPRAAVLALTAAVGKSLGDVTIQLEEWDELPLLAVAERLWLKGPQERRTARLAALAKGWKELCAADPAEAAALRMDLESFERDLTRLGASPGHLDVEYPLGRVLRFVFRSGLVTALALVAKGAARLWFAPAWFVQSLVLRARRPSEDVVATYKVLSAIVLFPLWHGTATLLLSGPFGWPTALLMSLAALALSVVATALWHHPARTLREVRLWLRRGTLAQSGQLRQLASLRRRRAHLTETLTRLAERRGELSETRP
ncbi:MAG: acyltransferase [Planctomycetaceae bacterium]|nr:acyltransferase [Planctomycetaceae bacterium]